MMLGDTYSMKRRATAKVLAPIALALLSTFISPSANAEPTPAPSTATEIYKAALDEFRENRELYLAAMKVRNQQIKYINQAFKITCDKANQDFKVGMSAARTPDQKSALYAARKSAISAAIIARDNAFELLGDEPIAPIEPMKPLKTFSKSRSR